MKSNYSVRLYELLVQWKNSKQTPIFKLEEFRGQLGLGTSEYKAMCDFKKRVLDFAVKEINEKTDIKVQYEQVKKGRKIIGFRFLIKTKKPKETVNRDSDTPDMLAPFSMTDKQRIWFANKLSELPELGSYCPEGLVYDQYAIKIAQELLDPKKQSFYKPYLIKLGFKD